MVGYLVIRVVDGVKQHQSTEFTQDEMHLIHDAMRRDSSYWSDSDTKCVQDKLDKMIGEPVTQPVGL